jgi:hypothetical protein
MCGKFQIFDRNIRFKVFHNSIVLNNFAFLHKGHQALEIFKKMISSKDFENYQKSFAH